MERPNSTRAVTVAVVTFTLWGILPVYWKIFGAVPAPEVLAHRVVWSFVFMILLVLITGRTGELGREIRLILVQRQKLFCLVAGAVFISCNWLTYIWAVNHDRVVESGLGYYICPLFNVLAGVVVLRERLSLWQFLAVLLAVIGVIQLTVNYGSFPLVAITLATTMTIYGLCKKVTGLSAIGGMTLETALTTPIALIFFSIVYGRGGGYPVEATPVFIALVGAGAVTAIPLIMFAYSLNRLSMTVLGLIQYISPTLTLLLGILVYDEVFTRSHLITFIFIWSGLVLFTLSRTAPLRRLERRLSRALGRL